MSNFLSKIKIKNIFDRDPNKFELRPNRAWAAIFLAGTILSAATLALHFFLYAFSSDSRAVKTEDAAAGDGVRLNRKGLANVSEMFEAKNVQFQNILTSPLQIADPSLPQGSGTRIIEKTQQNATGTVPSLVE
ncbi:MAG: hypothetical protein HYT94_00215 [Parcubacteria group bacterium]|nr:hypothetical protein [Parcubacteria group bacterium]